MLSDGILLTECVLLSTYNIFCLTKPVMACHIKQDRSYFNFDCTKHLRHVHVILCCSVDKHVWYRVDKLGCSVRNIRYRVDRLESL